MMKRPLMMLGIILATVLMASGCDYIGSGPKVALFGDSVADDADTKTVPVMRQQYRYFRLNLRAGSIADQLIPIAITLDQDPPERMIVEMGIGDAQEWRTDLQMRHDIRRVLNAARGVSCVRWPNLKLAGVNGFYQGVVARSDDFNRILAEEVVRYPNTEMVDYDGWAQARPGYFLADGLHHNGRGRTAYGQWLTNTVAGSC